MEVEKKIQPHQVPTALIQKREQTLEDFFGEDTVFMNNFQPKGETLYVKVLQMEQDQFLIRGTKKSGWSEPLQKLFYKIQQGEKTTYLIVEENPQNYTLEVYGKKLRREALQPIGAALFFYKDEKNSQKRALNALNKVKNLMRDRYQQISDEEMQKRLFQLRLYDEITIGSSKGTDTLKTLQIDSANSERLKRTALAILDFYREQ